MYDAEAIGSREENCTKLGSIKNNIIRDSRQFVQRFSLENVCSLSLITRRHAHSNYAAHSEMQFLQVDRVTGNSFRRDGIA